MTFKEYLAREKEQERDRDPPAYVHGILFGWMDGARTDPADYLILPMETTPPSESPGS